MTSREIVERSSASNLLEEASSIVQVRNDITVGDYVEDFRVEGIQRQRRNE
eukprot:CAMPEP_0194031762 /NCGR_PEP_ID=MMETSP0009_2-20130614/4855_1 /TAXON_ID=210454 /ORGANISM="Grammatophora oceanica, Strain CCMP 410" /LENGTH=50 /DNA_ID=CAMNT_0038671995 /DNA_START=441 /DNA_END=593 /DNA_ORIENTATION=+